MDDPLQTPREQIEKVRCDPETKRKDHVKEVKLFLDPAQAQQFPVKRVDRYCQSLT